MTSAQEERHIHLEQCVADLNEAWRLGQAISEAGDNPLRGAAFKYMLVAYSRPFKESRGFGRSKHRLARSEVPVEHQPLHDRLLAARDKVLAHSDFAPRDPRLHVAETFERRFAMVVQNVVDGMEELQNLTQVLALIEATLKNLYEKGSAEEQALPVTIKR